MLKGTAVYQSEEDNEEMDASEVALDNSSAAAESKLVRTDIEERPLDPNHNIFILVDSGVSDQARGKESELRARFERCISQWSGAKVSQDATAGVAPGPGNLSGAITSSTHLQQTRGSSQSATNENVQSTGTLQGEGATSATSVTKGSSGAGGSSSTSGLHKSTGADQLTGSQGMTATRFQGEKSMIDLTGKPTKSSKTVGSEADILVPMCGLVVGGDRFTLRQVYCSMIQNRCPIVVTKGTSGAADVIAFGLDAASKIATEETVDDKEPVPLENRIESIIEEFLSDMHPDCQSYTEEVNMLCEIINDYSNLVSVFDMEEDSDLDGYVISSLLASAGSIVASDQINLEQLEITLTLNRADIAREKIFLENKKWKKGQLNDYMYQALMGDRHDFVKLFLEQGFSLEEFLTVYMLEKLYTDQLKNMQSSKVALRDVGKVIKALVGDFYHPLYLSKEFQGKLMPDKRLEGAAARNAVRRGAASGEAGPTDLTDSNIKRADNAKTTPEDEYVGRGLPRSSTTVTTVSGDVLLPTASPNRISAANDRSADNGGQVSRERRLGRAPPVYEASSVRQNLYVASDRSASQGRGENSNYP
ncbi:uncharacterized protein DEA37_0005687 [Paragonimus westermani]|uniref:TRPM SLOG domain-containing protein n=1 Tax=Paragonimus westermani TaxID=34504 RepID=A0A5J4NQN8_9TREM|nr:uncharacterized protein DEA37_0005687 [Paragonimus westermani]